eukprot:CAMPEP_0176018030 /NCGR_PEP_ID=MMETSP0120_2-20121206/8667_1 /TAXON_ID=160619 /ORGANISM="Kryptoperidinium foliaceum, Strain CCMP 1326" /LENGTH=526 /DNA_ID=CAMNT_0017351067 /DNA_START=84 /DNA_END=1664 /DNA_ORIENTATION=+
MRVMDGSAMHQALECTTLAMLFLVLRASRLGHITTEQLTALLLFVTRVRFGIVMSCGVLFGATDLVTEVVMFPIRAISAEGIVLHIQMRSMIDCSGWISRVKTLCFALAGPVLALYWRGLQDNEAERLANVLALVVVLTVCIVAAMCWSVSKQQALTREKDSALVEMQMVYASLNEVKNGMARMLSAVCDVVAEADGQLRFRCASWALHDLLGCPGEDPTKLNGREIFEFLPTEEALECARMCLVGCPGNYSGPQDLKDQAGQAVSAAPAAVFTTEMRSECGMRFIVDVYHVRVFTSPSDMSEHSYLLGFRVKDRCAEDFVFPPAPEADAAKTWVDERAAHGTEPPTGVMPWNLSGPTMLDSCLSSAGSESRSPKEDLSHIALPFDAGSESFAVYRRSVFAANLKKPHKTGLLRWIQGERDSHAFEQWVVDEVNRHTAAEAEGRSFNPTVYPGELTLKLPAAASRLVCVRNAVLEINPQDSVRDLPVTLHISGVRPMRHVAPQPTVDDETCASSEDISWSDSASAI